MQSARLAIIVNVAPDIEGHQYDHCDKDDYIKVVENGTQRGEVFSYQRSQVCKQ